MAENLHKISDAGSRLSGRELFFIASRLVQIIDGKFVAYFEQEDDPWLLIKAIDSSSYDIETTDKGILEKVRTSFSEVTDLPSY